MENIQDKPIVRFFVYNIVKYLSFVFSAIGLILILILITNLNGIRLQLYLFKDGVTLIIQLLLLAGALWLAFETFMLKIRTEEQIKLVKAQTEIEKQQAMLAVTPYLTATPARNTDIDLIGPQRGFDPITSDKIKFELRQIQMKGSNPKHCFLIHNHTPRIATHVSIIVFNPKELTFNICSNMKNVIGDNGYELLVTSGADQDNKSVDLFIQELYKIPARSVSPMLAIDNDTHLLNDELSFTFLLYRDITGVTHCIQGGFKLGEKGYTNYLFGNIYPPA